VDKRRDFVGGGPVLIRGWVESTLAGFRSRFTKSFGRSALAGQLKADWLEVLYIIAIITFTAGTVAAIIEPVNVGYVIFPNPGGQSATETVVDAFVLLLGTAGVYISYLSGRQTTKTRMVNFFLIIGLFLILMALYIGIYVLSAKG
jgi:hypothetical protein